MSRDGAAEEGNAGITEGTSHTPDQHPAGLVLVLCVQ